MLIINLRIAYKVKQMLIINLHIARNVKQYNTCFYTIKRFMFIHQSQPSFNRSTSMFEQSIDV